MILAEILGGGTGVELNLALTIGGLVLGAAVAHAVSRSKLADTVDDLEKLTKRHGERLDVIEDAELLRRGKREGRREALLESSASESKVHGDRPRRRDHDDTGEFKRR